MPGKLKSELADEFYRKNLDKIDSAVDQAKLQYQDFSGFVMDELRTRGYDQDDKQLIEWMDWLKAFDTVIRAHDRLHANFHHFQKYHAAQSDAWGNGHYYLGTECVSCEYTRSQIKPATSADDDITQNTIRLFARIAASGSARSVIASCAYAPRTRLGIGYDRTSTGKGKVIGRE